MVNQGRSIGIVIPVYEQPKLLAEAVATLRQQTIFDQLEICITSDGGKSKSQAQILRALANQNPNITVLSTPNQGPGAARNTAIDWLLQHAPSLQAVYFLDADNRLETWAMECALSHLQRTGAD